MQVAIEPSILYFGTPVVLISTRNEDGTTNVAPMSSTWFLGWGCMIGLNSGSQTTLNLLREKECVLNLPSVDQAYAPDRLARLTGRTPLTPDKVAMGYRYEKDKLGAAGLTAMPSDLVRAPRVAECPIQLEALLQDSHRFGGFEPARAYGADTSDTPLVLAVELKIVRMHADESLVAPGKRNHIDPDKWKPLLMSFAQYYGLAPGRVLPSKLAEIPEEQYRPYEDMGKLPAAQRI
jgi:flavin reductase (DIM6/NTAB) family NADH-FMN oxidoreductase RutF